MQGKFPPEDVDAALEVRDKFGQRAGETEFEWQARLRRDNEALIAEMDRREAEEQARG